MIDEYCGWFALKVGKLPSELLDERWRHLVRLTLLADDIATAEEAQRDQQQASQKDGWSRGF